MNISEAVRQAAEDNNINGVVAMAKHCKLSYERTVRVWKGDNSAKIADVMTVLGSVGLILYVGPKND